MLLTSGAAAIAAPGQLVEIGFASVDVTPPIGHRMSGYFYERFSTGVHNPLQAKAIVFRQGDERFAWVFCDLLGVPSTVSSVVRNSAAAETGIPRQNIFIAATHTHTGPLYFGPLRDFFHAQTIKLTGKDEHEATDYARELTGKLTELIAAAAAATKPTELSLAVVPQPGLAFNRRYILKDGSVATNPGKLNPNIARPAGPTDVDLSLLHFRRQAKPVACLSLFALHLDTTGGADYAADFPFYLERDLRAAFGSEYRSIFGIGTCGDVNHFDVSHDRPQKGHEESERIGATIAATAVAALQSPAPLANPDFAAAAATIDVPLQAYAPAEVAAARASLPKVGTREMPMLDQVSAVKIVGIDDYGVKALPMDVQAFRLSDTVAAVALPGELFAELGLAIKQRSPFATTLVFELSNDYPGYIPTRRAFAEGGYEPANSKIAPGGGEQLVDTAVALLHQLKGGEPPVSAAK
jgi:neutral ceramidase